MAKAGSGHPVQLVAHESETTGNVYKKRVVPIGMEHFRVLFNLNEIRDKKTGKVLQESSYESYKDIRSNILQVAQNELYDLYLFHASNVWFDFQAGPRKGIGGKTSSIIIYIYTRENPKEYGLSIEPPKNYFPPFFPENSLKKRDLVEK